LIDKKEEMARGGKIIKKKNDIQKFVEIVPPHHGIHQCSTVS
jgi:hypothetical protein